MSDFRVISYHETLKGNFNYLKEFFYLQNIVDKENWEHFGIETEEEFGKRLLKSIGSIGLTRIVLKNNIPVGYIEGFLINDESLALLYEDTYKFFGLDVYDLLQHYNPHGDMRGYVLYVNVVAIKKEEQGNALAVRNLLKAMKEIEDEVSKAGVSKISTVAVTDAGRKMCQLYGMKQLSSVFRKPHERTFYIKNTNQGKDSYIKTGRTK